MPSGRKAQSGGSRCSLSFPRKGKGWAQCFVTHPSKHDRPPERVDVAGLAGLIGKARDQVRGPGLPAVRPEFSGLALRGVALRLRTGRGPGHPARRFTPAGGIHVIGTPERSSRCGVG
jgi:hypothetical protein